MNIITDNLQFIRNKSNIIYINNSILYFNTSQLYEYNILEKTNKIIYDNKTDFIQQIFLINEKIYFNTLNSIYILKNKEIERKLDFNSLILKVIVDSNFLFVLTENSLIKISNKFIREVIIYGEFINFSITNSNIFIYKTDEILKIIGNRKTYYKIIEEEDIDIEIFECIEDLIVFGYKTYLDVYKIINGELKLYYKFDMLNSYQTNNNKKELFIYNQLGVFSLLNKPKKILNESYQFINGEVAILNDALILLPFQIHFNKLDTIKEERNEERKKDNITPLKDIQIEVINIFSPLFNLANKEINEFKIEYIYKLSCILLQIQCVQKMIPEKLEILKYNYENMNEKINKITLKRSNLLNKMYEMYEDFNKIEEKYRKIKLIKECGKDFLEKYKEKISEWKKFEKRIKSQNSLLKELLRKNQ